MPSTKFIAVYSEQGVRAVFRYLQDKRHSHHLDVRIDPLQYRGVLSVDEFAAGTTDGLRALNSRASAGRKTTTHGTWKILTFPPESWLTDEERDWFTNRIIERLQKGQPLAWCWHHNRLTGSSDLNIVDANFFGKPSAARSRRRRNRNEWLELCRMSDDVADELNGRREASEETKITTMAEAKSAKGRGVRDLELATALAGLPAPVKLKELAQSIVKLGWTVTRINYERDYISVVPPNTSSLPNPKSPKPKRLKITSLLDLVTKARMPGKQKKLKHPSEISRDPS